MDSKEIEEVTSCRLNDVGALIFEVKWKRSWIGENLLKKYINGNSSLIDQMDYVYKEFQKAEKLLQEKDDGFSLVKTEPFDDYEINETTLFICNICNQTFQSHSALKGHQRTCLTLVSNNDIISYDISSTTNQLVNDCASNSSRKPVSDIVDELRRSKTQEQTVSNEVIPTAQPNNQASVNQEDLSQLLQTGSIDQHMELGNIVAVFECENCHMTFADADYLARHKVRCKNHEFSAIRCEICQRGFTTKGSLDLHIDAVHLKKKEFGCNICGKKFARKHILKVHLTTHTGQRDFQCSVCGKSFKQKSNLNRHERIHESKNFGYRCRFCGQAFTQNKHLKKHMNVMHPNNTIEIKPEESTE